MSRSFAILLILLGSVILASFVWLHLQLRERQHAGLFTYAQTVNERLIEQKQQEITVLHQATEAFFEDDAYLKRSVVLPVFTEAERQLKVYFEALENQDRRFGDQDPGPLAAAALAPIVDTAVRIFQKYHLQLDLGEAEMQNLVHGWEQLQISYQHHQTAAFSSPATLRVKEQVITLELLANISDLLTQLTNLSCHRGCEIDVYFPVVTSGSNYVQAGQELELNLAIGSYTRALQPKNVLLLVGGDTVRIGTDGIGTYQLPAGSAGEHTLRTKCIITNPLTGEVKVGESLYTYRAY